MWRWFNERLARKSSEQMPQITHQEEYLGYRLQIQPRAEGHQFRVAALIVKPSEPELSHLMIRADLCPTLQIATEQSLYKARQAVDQLGDELFRKAPQQ